MGNPKGGRPRGGLPSPEVLERQNEVVKLRRGGLTWDLIAQRVGYSDPSGAQKAYEAANKRIIAEDIAEIRNLETERLDLAQSAIWGKVLQGDNPSIANLLRIMERRAKLLGLDQPTRIQAEVITYDGNAVRTELERILASRSDSSPQSALAEGSSESEPTTTGE
jgi:hypothetical protein